MAGAGEVFDEQTKRVFALPSASCAQVGGNSLLVCYLHTELVGVGPRQRVSGCKAAKGVAILSSRYFRAAHSTTDIALGIWISFDFATFLILVRSPCVGVPLLIGSVFLRKSPSDLRNLCLAKIGTTHW